MRASMAVNGSSSRITRRVLEDGAGEQDALHLAARERADGPRREAGEPDPAERRLDARGVPPPEPRRRRRAAATGRPPRSRTRRSGRCGRSRAAAAGRRCPAIVRPRPLDPRRRASSGVADDAPQQRRLAGAVRADEGEELPVRDAPVDILHGRPAAPARMAERHAVERERRHASAQAIASQSRPDRSAAAASLSATPERPTITDRERERRGGHGPICRSGMQGYNPHTGSPPRTPPGRRCGGASRRARIDTRVRPGSETRMQRTFLCVIEGRDDSWEATCLDLDIAVAGTSFDGAKHDLERAVAQYVQAALQESPADRERLLPGQAPLGLRLRAAGTATTSRPARCNRRSGNPVSRRICSGADRPADRHPTGQSRPRM